MFEFPNFFRTNPIALFFRALITKWYLFFSLICLSVLYWVYNGLKDLGLIAKASGIVIGCFLYAQAVARNCTPLILDAGKFSRCMMDPPEYNPPTTDTEKQIEKLSHDVLNDEQDHYDFQKEDPYMKKWREENANTIGAENSNTPPNKRNNQ